MEKLKSRGHACRLSTDKLLQLSEEAKHLQGFALLTVLIEGRRAG